MRHFQSCALLYTELRNVIPLQIWEEGTVIGLSFYRNLARIRYTNLPPVELFADRIDSQQNIVTAFFSESSIS